MKMWGADVPNNSALNKIQKRAALVKITSDLEGFIDSLFMEDSEDTRYDYFVAENPYKPKQLKWAITRFMRFRVDTGMIKGFSIPLVVSAPKVASIKLKIKFDDVTAEISMNYPFN